jgi:uncharacterized protein YegL
MSSTSAPAKPRRKKKASTDLAVAMILDKSGSMGHLAGSVIDGFNEYVNDLREQDGDTLLSLTLFDTEFEQVYVGAPLAEVEQLTGKTYRIGGGTALYDAIAFTVKDLEARVAREGKQDSKVLVVTMTDGAENMSTDYTAESLAALVREYEAKGNWTFVYLGLGQSSEYVGTMANVGYSGQNGYFMAASSDSVARTMASVSMATSTLRSSVSMSSVDVMGDAGAAVMGVAGEAVKPTESGLLDHLTNR